MEELSRNIVEALGLNPFWEQVFYALAIIVVAVVVFMAALTIAGLLTYLERRVAGRIQSRVGPNRVGPLGLLQWLADGLKLVMKEDLIPACADRPMFRLAPYAVVVGVFAAFVSVPFGQLLIAADLNVGIIYLLAITSLVSVGVLMSGWASNNKWSLLGGIRSAAQIVSYEVPSALSILSVVLLAGTLSMQGIIQAQGGQEYHAEFWARGGWPWNWFIFHNPFAFIAFFLYFTAAVAEGNRTPFDLPEAESELVSGYNTEYSGMRFAGFFLGEFANIYLMSAVATTLFFGGWQIPGILPEEQASSWSLQLMGLLIFVFKAAIGCFVVIWLRWTLPRLRVDQLMGLCYKYLVPFAFICLGGNAVYILLIKAGSTFDWIVHGAMTLFGFALVVYFFVRVTHHIRLVKDRVDFDILSRGTKKPFDPAVQTRRYGRHRKGARALEITGQQGKEIG